MALASVLLAAGFIFAVVAFALSRAEHSRLFAVAAISAVVFALAGVGIGVWMTAWPPECAHANLWDKYTSAGAQANCPLWERTP